MNRKKEGNCTISESSPCTGCKSNGILACKFSKEALHAFFKIGFPPVVVSLTGLILAGFFTGHWWMLIVYAIYTFGMLGAVEMLFLCHHCPYYAAEGNTIVCIGNYGSLKLLPYNPAPMNGFERFMMRFFVVTAFFILPLGGMGFAFVLTGLASLPLFTLMAVITTLILFFSIRFVKKLISDFCTKCINFSCPFNKVSKDVVDDYLSKNRLMREAWEKTGYKIG